MGDREFSTLGLTGRAQVFDHPLVARDRLGDRLFHQLLLGVDRSTWSGGPVRPAEDFRNAAWIGRLRAGVDFFAMVMIRATRIRSAELLAFRAPDDNLDFLLFADQPTDLLAVVAAGADPALQEPLACEDAGQRPGQCRGDEAGQDGAASVHDKRG